MSNRLDIEIETDDRHLGYELLGASTLSAGNTSLTLSDGSTVTYAGTIIRKALEIPSILELVVTLIGSVSTGVASNWLYDQLKAKPVKLRINRREIEIHRDKIRIVIEEIEKEG